MKKNRWYRKGLKCEIPTLQILKLQSYNCKIAFTLKSLSKIFNKKRKEKKKTFSNTWHPFLLLLVLFENKQISFELKKSSSNIDSAEKLWKLEGTAQKKPIISRN